MEDRVVLVALLVVDVDVVLVVDVEEAVVVREVEVPDVLEAVVVVDRVVLVDELAVDELMADEPVVEAPVVLERLVVLDWVAVLDKLVVDVLVEDDNELVTEVGVVETSRTLALADASTWYILRRLGPPQYSRGLALQIMLQPVAASVVPATLAEPALIVLPQ